jgi:nicotinate-nucleotide pyrophosphorylase (carboxylating)
MVSDAYFKQELQYIIERAIAEDVGSGDYSSLASIPSSAKGKAKLLVKDTGIIAGIEFAKMILNYVDHTIEFEQKIEDGTKVKYGDEVFYLHGSSQSILKAERLLLNSMQRMSAIATKTNEFVKLLEGTKTKILDTRKTTPNFRACEKWAVKIGGGENHRYGLFDMIMLKDNHIDFAGGISAAITKTKQFLQDNDLDLKIIVEARNLDEVQEILKNDGVYRILLDNFNYENTRKAVKIIGSQCFTESSGNINENTIREYALCGVDYISSGSLTHSIYNMDLSLKAF